MSNAIWTPQRTLWTPTLTMPQLADWLPFARYRHNNKRLRNASNKRTHCATDCCEPPPPPPPSSYCDACDEVLPDSLLLTVGGIANLSPVAQRTCIPFQPQIPCADCGNFNGSWVLDRSGGGPGVCCNWSITLPAPIIWCDGATSASCKLVGWNARFCLIDGGRKQFVVRGLMEAVFAEGPEFGVQFSGPCNLPITAPATSSSEGPIGCEFASAFATLSA